MTENDSQTNRRFVPPKRRTYKHRSRGRDRDSAKLARTLGTLSWSLPAGIVGAAAGVYGGYVGWWNMVAGVVVGFVAAALVVFLMARALTEGVGTAAGNILVPSGESTPMRRGYSYPESLVARGYYDEAIAAYESCCTDQPDDPEPYVRIARLYRDQLGKNNQAVFWFKLARSEAVIDATREKQISQDIIDIYITNTDDPRNAIPELARLADRFADDPVSVWAKSEIARLRALPQDEK